MWGDVLGKFDKLLHLHHEGGDQLMYPQLVEGAPPHPEGPEMRLHYVEEESKTMTASLIWLIRAHFGPETP